MKKVVALIATALVLVAGSRWAFIHGANYDLKDYSPSEKVHLLDTTMIAEKWLLISGGMAVLAATCFILAVAFYFGARRKVFV